MEQPLSILIVEDDPDTRANLCDILGMDGHRIQLAGTAQEALEVAQDQGVEIIILDRKLPDATAEELLPKLLGLLPQARVIVMTGFANLNSTIAAFRAGAADYILKPVNVDALRNSLQHIQHTRRIERELERKQQFSNLILDTADAIILVLDLQGRIVQFNDFFHRTTGWELTELAGQDWFSHCIPERERKRIREVFIQTAIDSHSRGIVNPVLTKDGRERQIRWSNNILKDSGDGEDVVLAVGIDVTDHIAAEQQLLRAERLAGIGQTMAALAHESRNALQRIHAGVEMLEEVTVGNVDAHPDLMVIKRAANDLNTLLEEVRSFAAPIVLHVESVRLVDCIRNAWNNISHAGPEIDARLSEELPENEIVLPADGVRLEQVFRNLFENSIAATEHPSEISIRARCDEQFCHLLITDNGPGLSNEQKERVFEPFYTTKAKGTGLGMAIVKRIVTAHHGTIEVLPNDYGTTGARFSMSLPIERAASNTSFKAN